MIDNPLFRKSIEEGLSRSGGLELASLRRNAGMNGRRTSRGNGNALEFSEHREYHAGDDLRRLDWHVYARSEQLMIKLYTEEVDPRCDIILDTSSSMIAPGDVKAGAALGISALLSTAARNGGFSLAVHMCGDVLEKSYTPYSPFEWNTGDFDAVSEMGSVIADFHGHFQSRGIRIAVSDFLWMSAPETFLSRITDGAMNCVLIEILSSDDLNPTGSANTLLYDSESSAERELFLDENLLARYRERLARHREMWSVACGEYGVQMIRLEAEKFLESWNLESLFRCGVLKC